ALDQLEGGHVACYQQRGDARYQIESKKLSSSSTLPPRPVLTPSCNSLSKRHKRSPSIKSMVGNARIASRCASGVNELVVMISPFSARPAMAPRKSRTTGAPDPFQRLHWNTLGVEKDGFEDRTC